MAQPASGRIMMHRLSLHFFEWFPRFPSISSKAQCPIANAVPKWRKTGAFGGRKCIKRATRGRRNGERFHFSLTDLNLTTSHICEVTLLLCQRSTPHSYMQLSNYAIRPTRHSSHHSSRRTHASIHYLQRR